MYVRVRRRANLLIMYQKFILKEVWRERPLFFAPVGDFTVTRVPFPAIHRHWTFSTESPTESSTNGIYQRSRAYNP